MGEVNWDFAVHRWAKTALEVQATHGGVEVDARCKDLPPDFKARVIAVLKGTDEGGEYNQD